ncbi:MAG: PEP-CTERM sorting domain-containing protein [Betaproteobacteria bacterium]|nr:PEP-CTERM sorting domain-containing protein [Betaproteobacteria bacterium]
MKKTLLAVAVAGTLALSNVASADTILGITINPGDFLQIGTIWEGSLSTNGTGTIQATGEQLVGVGVVDVIKDADGNVTWASRTNGVYLAFYVDSHITQAIIDPAPAGPPINVLFSGGAAHFYQLNAAFTPVTGDYAASKAIIAAGNLFLDVTGGTSRLCTAADACIGGVGTAVTLDSTINSGNLGNIGSASGSGFLNVTGAGAADSILNTNSLIGGNDMVLGSSFNSGTATKGFGASGSIDIRGEVVPEPATLSLLGLGLLGLGAMRRRRNS